jgi:hypothetical protein
MIIRSEKGRFFGGMRAAPYLGLLFGVVPQSALMNFLHGRSNEKNGILLEVDKGDKSNGNRQVLEADNESLGTIQLRYA